MRRVRETRVPRSRSAPKPASPSGTLAPVDPRRAARLAHYERHRSLVGEAMLRAALRGLARDDPARRTLEELEVRAEASRDERARARVALANAELAVFVSADRPRAQLALQHLGDGQAGLMLPPAGCWTGICTRAWSSAAARST